MITFVIIPAEAGLGRSKSFIDTLKSEPMFAPQVFEFGKQLYAGGKGKKAHLDQCISSFGEEGESFKRLKASFEKFEEAFKAYEAQPDSVDFDGELINNLKAAILEVYESEHLNYQTLVDMAEETKSWFEVMNEKLRKGEEETYLALTEVFTSSTTWKELYDALTPHISLIQDQLTAEEMQTLSSLKPEEVPA